MMQEMWNAPPGFRPSKSAPCSPAKPIGLPRTRSGSFHITHKIPVGDTPYVRAKHVQLVDKDPEKAIPLFWAAINAGDRVDSALKDMAIVMKQQNRPEEAIEAIKSLRHRCSEQAQESLENILLDLYKRCGRLDDQVALLRHKLYLIQKGLAFNGKRTKTARSQGKKFQVSVEQEATRLLGNLGWALMQQNKYVEAEDAYRRALSIAPDNNKMCNLGICLMKQGRISEAKDTLRLVKPAVSDGPRGVDSHLKAYERAQQMLQDLESETMNKRGDCSAAEQSKLFESFLGSSSLWQPQPCKDHSVPLPTTSTVPATRNNTKPVLPSSCVGDEFPDENFINSIVAPTQAKQLASSYIGGGQKDIYGNSLNIYAPPFCPSETLTKEPVDLNQFQETHKRTRSGNAATNPVGENIPSHQSLRIQQHPSEDTAAALGANNNLLPDDKTFENAIISAVLNANSEDAGGRGSISSIMSVPSANHLRGGGTTTTTTATGGLQRKISSIGKRLKVFQDITLSLSPSPSPKA